MSPAARTPGRRLVVEADGGSRGNPGVAGWGALVRDAGSGAVLVELAEPLGKASNNVAEYSGLIAGLRAAIDIDAAADVHVKMDSKLVVEQMAGRWKIKHEDMRRLALEARELCSELSDGGGTVDFEWIPRASNKDADALSNEAMDGHSVHRVLDPSASDSDRDDGGDTDRSADTDGSEPVRARTPLRLLLVQQLEDGSRDAVERVADAVRGLVGSDVRFLSGGGAAATELSGALGLPTSAEADPSWSAAPGSEGPDARVRAAYAAIVEAGGTVVVLTSRQGVLTVLSEVLDLPAAAFWRLATAPGSLTGVEVWEDGVASVAFTNRTAHLA
ncbi:MAG: reverse transcriptase-like protein [Terracoccus sp.]